MRINKIMNIYKIFGWKNEWKLVKRVYEGVCKTNVYDIFVDENKNGLKRYKKIKVNSSSAFNQNNKL